MTIPAAQDPGVDRLPTAIPGLDAIAGGGLPRDRATLVVGTAGAGKTVLAMQFLAAGAREHDECGVLVTFDESRDSLLRNAEGFEWGFAELVEDGRIAIVDASPDPSEEFDEVGSFDLMALLARIMAQVERTGARRLVLDSVSALLSRFAKPERVRRELARVVKGLDQVGVTTVLTAERIDDYGAVARYSVEEFVADAVVILRNPLEQQRRRRTIEILKLRGGPHQSGEFPLTIDGREGVSVIPISAVELDRESSTERISFGNPGIDGLFGGGVYRDSLVLVSGPTGTGKTLMAMGFVKAALDAGERALVFAFEESRNQLLRNAGNWVGDLRAAEEQGQIRMVATYPERMGLEDLLQELRRSIQEFRPQRVIIDSLTALERVSSQRSFREFVVRIATLFKQESIAGLVTNTSSMISGGETITDAYVSTTTDGIVVLRYAEVEGELRRAIAVLKMRGSAHDRFIREFTISGDGMTVGEPIQGAAALVVRSPGGLAPGVQLGD